MARDKRVLLVIESSRAYGRGCLRGIAAYTRAHPGWQILHLERSLTEALPTFIKGWRGDGIISRIETDDVAEAVRSLKLPTVDLRGIYRLPGGALFDTNPITAAMQAANHFLERGFRHFAYCGFPGLAFSDEREDAFVVYLRERGINPHVYHASGSAKHRATGTIAQESYGETHLEKLMPWLQSLPKPIGLMACNDVRGRQVIGACEMADLKIPDEVAVVGVDNDEVICELSNPPLSSVVPDTHRLGYEGARLLDRIMNEGMEAPTETILIPPLNVCTRLSSDVLAIDDNELVTALRFIRENACEGINVDDVIRKCDISRSTLERRFLKFLGCGPKEQILKMRFERAMTLLRETDYELLEIARLTGFRTAAHLVTAFKQHTGKTPGQYRHEVRD